jgi:hypothetical protein
MYSYDTEPPTRADVIIARLTGKFRLREVMGPTRLRDLKVAKK